MRQRDAERRRLHRGRVVDAVTDKPDLSARLLQVFDLPSLFLWRQAALNFDPAQQLGGAFGAVTGHYGTFNALLLQQTNRFICGIAKAFANRRDCLKPAVHFDVNQMIEWSAAQPAQQFRLSRQIGQQSTLTRSQMAPGAVFGFDPRLDAKRRDGFERPHAESGLRRFFAQRLESPRHRMRTDVLHRAQLGDDFLAFRCGVGRCQINQREFFFAERAGFVEDHPVQT